MRFLGKRAIAILLVTLAIFSLLPTIMPVHAADPAITFNQSTNTLTVSGYPSGAPASFEDLIAADQAGTLTLTSRSVATPDPNPVALSSALRLGGSTLIGGNQLFLNVTSFSGLTSALLIITGTDSNGDSQSEYFDITGIAVYYSTNYYVTLTSSQVVSFTSSGSGISTLSYKLIQNQWGAISTTGVNQYVLHSYISLETGTYLRAEDAYITFDSRIVSSNGVNIIKGGGVIVLGRAEDPILKTSSHGCTLYAPPTVYYFNWINTGGAYFYSCVFAAEGSVHAIVYANIIWNTEARGSGFSGFRTAWNCDFYNVTCLGTYYGMYLYADVAYGHENNITLIGNTYAIRNYANGQGNGLTLSNIYARNNTYLFCNQAVTVPISQYLINVDADYWTFDWQSSFNTVYRQYTYDVKVVDGNGNPISGANVTLLDNQGEVFSKLTNVTGLLPTTAVSRGYYNSTGGDKMYDLAPFTLVVTAPGYSTSTTEVSFIEPTSSVVVLQPYSGPSPSPSPSGTPSETPTPTPVRNDTEPYITSRFTFTPSNPVVNNTVLFDGSSSKSSSLIEEYFWDFGDGTNSSSVAIPHFYRAVGNYTVTLTVTSAAGTDLFSQVVNVSVAPTQTVEQFPWWWLIIALLILFLVLLLILLIWWRRRDVIVIQTCGESDNPKCHGDGKCDDCELKPC